MKDNLAWLVLLSCISLFGLVSYKLANPNLNDEEKKKVSYAQITISFFASFMILVFMILLAMGAFVFITRGDLYGKSRNNLKYFIWAIFCIITSPFGLSIIQYSFQDNLGDNDKFLSIGILLSTIYSAIPPLTIIIPSLNAHNKLSWLFM